MKFIVKMAFVILVIYLFGCEDSSVVTNGKSEIKLVDDEFKNGYVTIYGYGLPGPDFSFYSKEYHVPVKMVAGCIVDEKIVSSVARHNKIIDAKIKAGFLASNELSEFEKYFTKNAQNPADWPTKFYDINEEFRLGELKLKLSTKNDSYDFTGIAMRDNSPIWVPGRKPIGKIKVLQRLDVERIGLISFVNEYKERHYNNYIWIDTIGGVTLFMDVQEVK